MRRRSRRGSPTRRPRSALPRRSPGPGLTAGSKGQLRPDRCLLGSLPRKGRVLGWRAVGPSAKGRSLSGPRGEVSCGSRSAVWAVSSRKTSAQIDAAEDAFQVALSEHKDKASKVSAEFPLEPPTKNKKGKGAKAPRPNMPKVKVKKPPVKTAAEKLAEL